MRSLKFTLSKSLRYGVVTLHPKGMGLLGKDRVLRSVRIIIYRPADF